MEPHIIILLLYLITVAANPCDTRQKTAFPHEDDCRRYYLCRRGTQVALECPTGHNFDVDTNTCRIAFLAKCNRREIPTVPPCTFSSTTENPRPYCNDTSKIIFLTDPENCQYFYICIWGDRVHRKCLNNWYFSVSKQLCLPEHKADCAEPKTATSERITTEKTILTTIPTLKTTEDANLTTNFITTITEETIPTTMPTSKTTEDANPTTNFITTVTEETFPTTIPTSKTTEDANPTINFITTKTEEIIPTAIPTSKTTEGANPITTIITTITEEIIPNTIPTLKTTEDANPTTNSITTITEETSPTTITTITTRENTIPTTNFTTTTSEETIPTTITTTMTREDTTLTRNFTTTSTKETIPTTISMSTTTEETTPTKNTTTTTRENTTLTTSEEMIPTTISMSTTTDDTIPTTTVIEDTTPTTKFTRMTKVKAIPTTFSTITTTKKITPTLVFTTETPEDTTQTKDFTITSTEVTIPTTISTITTTEMLTPTEVSTTTTAEDLSQKTVTEETTPAVVFTTTTPEDIIPSTIATTTTTNKSTTTVLPTTPSDYLRCGRRDNWLKPDYTDCEYYYQCLFGYSYHQKCPGGLLFSPTLLKCQLQGTVDCSITNQNVTPLPGTKRTKCGNDTWPKPDDNDCQYYYQCKDGYIDKNKCPENFMFSQSSQICVGEAVADCYKSNTTFTLNEKILEKQKSSTTITPAKTRKSSSTTQQQQLECSVADLWIKPDPRNCSHYYFCTHGKLQHYVCSTFYLFSPKEMRCVNKNVAGCLLNSADQIPFSNENTLFRSSSSAESDTNSEDVNSPESKLAVVPPGSKSPDIPVTPSESWANTERVLLTSYKSITPTTGVSILSESSSNVGASTVPIESSTEAKFTNIASEFSTELDSNVNKEQETSVIEISTENVVKKESESSKRTEENVKEEPLYETKEKLKEDCDSLSLWIKPDIGSCKHYYLCVYGELTHRHCPEDYEFNPVDLQCQPKQKAGCYIHLFTNVAKVKTPDQVKALSERYAPSWTEAGTSAIKCDDSSQTYRPDPDDCSKYYMCFYRHLYIQFCPKGLEFSETELKCLPPSQAKCNAICKTDGIYFVSNPTDKTKYYICFNRNPIPQKCPQRICS